MKTTIRRGNLVAVAPSQLLVLTKGKSRRKKTCKKLFQKTTSCRGNFLAVALSQLLVLTKGKSRRKKTCK